MSDRNTCWSLTINNPTPDDEESIAIARQKGWKVEGQREQGENGTEHYQLILRTPQVRFAAVKKIFARAHIEAARNPAALSQYVAKAETRVGSIPVDQGMYPSQSKFFDLVWDVILADTTDRSEYRRGPNNRFVTPGNALVQATKQLIRRGYVVENIATNPMTLQSWKLFHDDFLHRKTNRQTDAVEVPQTNLAEEHNNAVDNS